MSKTEKWEEFLNAECDGSGPHAMLAGNPPVAETRWLRTTGNAGAILCYSCYRREIRWRMERNQELAPENAFAVPEWETLRVYATLPVNCGITVDDFAEVRS